MGEVIQMRRETPEGIAHIMGQTWPANREKGDYRALLREQADLEPRRVICGFCGRRSRMLRGPEGRAWFSAHECGRS